MNKNTFLNLSNYNFVINTSATKMCSTNWTKSKLYHSVYKLVGSTKSDISFDWLIVLLLWKYIKHSALPDLGSITLKHIALNYNYICNLLITITILSITKVIYWLTVNLLKFSIKFILYYTLYPLIAFHSLNKTNF